MMDTCLQNMSEIRIYDVYTVTEGNNGRNVIAKHRIDSFIMFVPNPKPPCLFSCEVVHFLLSSAFFVVRGMQ